MHASRRRSIYAAVFAVVALLAALVVMAPSAAQAPPAPDLGAVMDGDGSGNSAVGQSWVGDVEGGVTVELFEPGVDPDVADPLVTPAPVGFPDPGSNWWFGVDFGITFGPGYQIRGTGNDSGHVVDMVVADLRVTDVDRVNGVVSGTTTADSPVWAEVYLADAPGDDPRTVVRNAVKAGPDGDGVYSWTVDFTTDPEPGTGESGEPGSFPVDVLTGQAGTGTGQGTTLAGFSTLLPGSIAVHYDNAHPGEFYGRVAAHDMAAGELTLTVERWSESLEEFEVVYEETVPSGSDYPFVQGHGGPDPFFVERGDRVTVSAGVGAKVHEVYDLFLNEIDYDQDIVSGTTDDTDHEVCVDLWSAPGPPRRCTAEFGPGGEWSVDFDAAIGEDIVPQSDLAAWQYDDDGDATTMNNSLLRQSPRQIEVYPELDLVGGWDALLSLTVQRGGVQVYPEPGEEATGYYGFDLWRDGFDLRPGDLVTVSDGETTKEHVVRSQTITELVPDSHPDPDQRNRVSGTAPQGTTISIRYNTIASGLSDDQLLEDAIYTVGESGEWTHVFPDGFPVVAGIAIEVGVSDQPDADNDATVVVAYVPAPTITAWPPAGSGVEGRGWPAGMPVDISAEGFDVYPSPVPDRIGAFPWDTAFIAELYNQAEEYWQLEPGHVVTATTTYDGGEITKDHTVVALTFDELNADEDYAAGTAPDGTVVEVGVGNDERGFGLEVVAELPVPPEEGPATWFADFGAEGFDVTEDMGGDARVYDDDGDATAVGLGGGEEPGGGPYVLAIKTEGDKSSFVGGGWNPDTEVMIEVFDQSGDYAFGLGPWFEPVVFPHPEDPGGRVDHFFEEFPGFLEPGWTVRATGQDTGRVVDVLVVDLVVEGFDEGRIFGTTDYEPSDDYVGLINVEVFAPEHAHRIASITPHDTEPSLWVWEADFDTEPGPDEAGGPLVWEEGVTFGQVGQESAIQGTGGILVHVGDFGGGPGERRIETDPLNDVIRVYGYDDAEAIGLRLNGGEVLEPTLDPPENLPGQDEEAFVFDVYPSDLKPGDVITSDAEGREHTVTPLTITDLIGTVVHGTTGPETTVEVFAGQAGAQGGQEAFQEVQADGSGTWFADFGFDVTHPSTFIRASEPDDDGDATVVTLGQHLAGIWVMYELDLVMVTDWTGLGPVTVSIDGTDVTVPVTRGPDPVSFGGFDFPEPLAWHALAEIPVDVVPGQTVTATDGIFATEHLVRDLRVEEADKDADTLSGSVDLFGVPSTLITFLVDEFGGAGVAFAQPAADGPWTVGLLDATAEEEVAYDLRHTDNIGIALLTDEVEGVEDGDFTAVLWDMAPHITSLDLPAEPVEIGTEVALHAEFTDIEVPDTHMAVVEWGDEVTMVDAAPAVIDEAHAYTTPGIYTVVLTVSDEFGGIDTAEYEFVVVYDPDGAFVTGGGWIDSPAGAYRDDPGLTGAVNFGLNAKYQNGAAVPAGNTNVQLHAGDLHFQSTGYNWLVAVADVGIYNGYGEMNGQAGYGFTVWVVDGDDDTFRLRVWEPGGHVIYDNEPTTLGGGNTKVHT